jgi:hypothetical protein
VKPDADLLLDLSFALEAPDEVPREPSVAELSRLRAAVEAKPARRERSRRPQLHVRRRIAAFGTAAIVATGGTAAAAAGAVPVPRVVRAVAHNVGLPVTAPEVDDVNDAVSRLRQAERSGDSERIAREARTLREALTRVDEDDREDVDDKASLALSSAEARLQDQPAVSETSGTSSTTMLVTPTSEAPGPGRATASSGTAPAADASLTHREWSGPASEPEPAAGGNPSPDVGPGPDGEPGTVVSQPPPDDDRPQAVQRPAPQPSDDDDRLRSDEEEDE